MPWRNPSVRSLLTFPLHPVHFQARGGASPLGSAETRRASTGPAGGRLTSVRETPTSLWTGSGATTEATTCEKRRIDWVRPEGP